MMRWVALTLRCAISDIVEKFNFLSVLPWRFAESGEPDQSLECIYLYRSSSGHDHVTLAIFGRLVSDIEARSRGEPMTEQHSTELGCFLNATLDEPPGGGLAPYIEHDEETRSSHASGMDNGHFPQHYFANQPTTGYD